MSDYSTLATPVAASGEESLNPFAIAQTQLDEAASLVQLDPAIHTLLREPLRELHVRLPVRMDDGTTKIFKGFRVQYNDA
ncbi:MAG TPA: Glu/Leu/Phe/Val dehydrogenase dimerization domain-containing protein, partial [Aggregatilineaceae bacterium]|nr:Glu/Leu/Phe/Val dehydrogenase dimerization domain-containing protein [Aggregatilineaceae bacterium]